jgi:hypothetical protein
MATIIKMKTKPGIITIAGRNTLTPTFQDIDLDLLSDDTILKLQEEYEEERLIFEDYEEFKPKLLLVISSDGGGGSSDGLTDEELRATPLETTAPTTVSKIEELRLQLVTLLGNTDNLETLTTSTNTLITNMITYVDQLETLSSSVVTNTADLTALLTDLGLNTDDIETILAEISAKLPSTLGKKTAANSLSVTLASDDGILDAINAVTAELQEKASLTETQPVSLVSIPLATGAATEAKQDNALTALSTLNTQLTALITELQTKADLTDTQPVSAASLPLPAGASTEARQVETLTSLTTVIARLQSILDELAPMTDGTLNNPVITRHIARVFTPGLLRVSTAGTVAVGAFEVSIANVGGVNGTVLGVALAPDEVVTFRAPLPGSTLGAIAYVGTDTTLLINTLVEVV